MATRSSDKVTVVSASLQNLLARILKGKQLLSSTLSAQATAINHEIVLSGSKHYTTNLNGEMWSPCNVKHPFSSHGPTSTLSIQGVERSVVQVKLRTSPRL